MFLRRVEDGCIESASGVEIKQISVDGSRSGATCVSNWTLVTVTTVSLVRRGRFVVSEREERDGALHPFETWNILVSRFATKVLTGICAKLSSIVEDLELQSADGDRRKSKIYGEIVTS